MDKEELINTLKNKCNTDDEEDNHLNADEALLDYINDPIVKKAFKDIDKWYS